jgi:DNA-binding CsgD family transcriptional regulator
MSSDTSESAISKRELEVIDSLLRGLTAQEVAVSMCLSFHTVRTHIRNVYEKIGVANRIELLRWRERVN